VTEINLPPQIAFLQKPALLLVIIQITPLLIIAKLPSVTHGLQTK